MSKINILQVKNSRSYKQFQDKYPKIKITRDKYYELKNAKYGKKNTAYKFLKFCKENNSKNSVRLAYKRVVEGLDYGYSSDGSQDSDNPFYAHISVICFHRDTKTIRNKITKNKYYKDYSIILEKYVYCVNIKNWMQNRTWKKFNIHPVETEMMDTILKHAQIGKKLIVLDGIAGNIKNKENFNSKYNTYITLKSNFYLKFEQLHSGIHWCLKGCRSFSDIKKKNKSEPNTYFYEIHPDGSITE